jgi:hypothetical protein
MRDAARKTHSDAALTQLSLEKHLLALFGASFPITRPVKKEKRRREQHSRSLLLFSVVAVIKTFLSPHNQGFSRNANLQRNAFDLSPCLPVVVESVKSRRLTQGDEFLVRKDQVALDLFQESQLL